MKTRNLNYQDIIRTELIVARRLTKKEALQIFNDFKEPADGLCLNTENHVFDFTLNGWENIKNGDRDNKSEFTLERIK